MTDWAQHSKDAFFVVGSIAGLFAFLRPAIESKYQKDLERANALLAKFDENGVMSLDSCTYNSRRIPEAFLLPFDEVRHKISENRQEVRFIGPLKKHLRAELEAMAKAYDSYRHFIQVPEWEPRDLDSNGQYEWLFNKSAFREGVRISDDYAKHLEAATEAAELLKKRFQRFQALTELHFFEVILPKLFVRRKMISAGLDEL
ncbi:MAG: hypothetical protein J0I01_09205 [Stenotrophomonas nitritireducens]|uniref:hypothetical protein n=1 Tax=Stenotrophomonas nitritireducens TaxID=83617 RepID=UPI001AD54A8F|nr:hypothetical protein [Stenotrophomonas nitritireducens]MBN8792390.1 hypothetical protein [Stenotrophomonas nitritireducens]MBN8797703.1 hypothetical protein [Stenotrophomonas nitritireducens]